MTKILSAGVIVTDLKSILLCHVTGARHWDIPKGRVDPGELEIDAAVRELYEETSIVINSSQLNFIGQFRYKKNKNLSLWLHKVDTMPDPSTLSCISTFSTTDGTVKTEMDGFAIPEWNSINKMVIPDMMQVLSEVRKMIR